MGDQAKHAAITVLSRPDGSSAGPQQNAGQLRGFERLQLIQQNRIRDRRRHLAFKRPAIGLPISAFERLLVMNCSIVQYDHVPALRTWVRRRHWLL